jgi:hypothetical protein
MITVSILINGKAIFTRSAINTTRLNSKGETIYEVDDGKVVSHKREEGAIKLGIKLLKLIKEL